MKSFTSLLLISAGCGMLFGLIVCDLKRRWLIWKFKRWLMKTPEDELIKAFIKAGYVRTDSPDDSIVNLVKGDASLTITRKKHQHFMSNDTNTL